MLYFEAINVTNFSERNSFKVRPYTRLDASFNLEENHKVGKVANGFSSFAVYNLHARNNVYSVNENESLKGYELSVLGSAIPSLTYNLQF